MKWAEHPNLRKRPRAPFKGRGPVQRAIRRAFVASDTEVLTSSSIYDWAYVRRRRGRRKSMPFGVYSRTLRTLRTMCDPVGRGPGSVQLGQEADEVLQTAAEAVNAPSHHHIELECALDGGQFQAAVLTGCWACRSSYCAGLR